MFRHTTHDRAPSCTTIIILALYLIVLSICGNWTTKDHPNLKGTYIPKKNVYKIERDFNFNKLDVTNVPVSKKLGS